MDNEEDFTGTCEVCRMTYVHGSMGVCRECIENGLIQRMSSEDLIKWHSQVWAEIKRLSNLEFRIGMALLFRRRK